MAKKSNKRERVAGRKRIYEGKVVIPVKYKGPHGSFMAGVVDDELVMMKNGKPLPFKEIGKLEGDSPPKE